METGDDSSLPVRVVKTQVSFATPKNPPPRTGASSEEESIAEMEYLSESSNVTTPHQHHILHRHHSHEDSHHLKDREDNERHLPRPRTASSTHTSPTTHHPSSSSLLSNNNNNNNTQNNTILDHYPKCLPKFREVNQCLWTASHAANSPSEDRSSCLFNVLLQPLPPNFNDSETQFPPLDYRTLLRVNMWCVIDGHGGGLVATYASEVLLPHLVANVSQALNCAIVDRGVCIVNGQLRDANALDLDGLIQTNDDASKGTHSNDRSIHYRSPREQQQLQQEEVDEEEEEESQDGGGTKASSSVKTSVKTAVSHTGGDQVGMHSASEVAAITSAISQSFLAVDEGWINSIDPIATHQTSCQPNGRWNSGACALAVFTVQRLDWTAVSEPDWEKEDSRGASKHLNTLQNEDAARRRLLDSRNKSVDMSSTASSTSSLTTEEAVNASGLESEITETEEEYGGRGLGEAKPSTRRIRDIHKGAHNKRSKPSIITPPGGCGCHCYRAHEAMLYTAHVGDCRAVLLGSAPPRTIKVREPTAVATTGATTTTATSSSTPDTTDDESSHHSSDETEVLSSSDHEADSSEDDEDNVRPAAATTAYVPPRRVPLRRQKDDLKGPYQPLPPLAKAKTSDSSTSTSEYSLDYLPPVDLPLVTRPIDLTTDHSAYNPAEVTAVLRRCNNAPRAISAGIGGGIKRVAGSLAVTRALGDAYLKTPELSFKPYKNHAPYITASPEINCRPLVKEGDKVLILASDGVWERATGEDLLRWVRTFYIERQAEMERRSKYEQTEEGKPEEQQSAPENPRKRTGSPTIGAPAAKRGRKRTSRRAHQNVADVIVRRVLNKVRRARNFSSLQGLINLPPGRARRSKHDDITATVVDLSAFVS